jgi:hypothetical protein
MSLNASKDKAYINTYSRVQDSTGHTPILQHIFVLAIYRPTRILSK